eukprot:CAMPEP_0197687214 /NCGR_PEP_ID=MMETSP1338-20131121/103671_1 /TAXON_ID=43686 ORGANISM="Pelagodinium beii, Strain RCC1491" /NCGR_SAMPLE_ID=MMETSP1338 /ASSEMBLY_ACC=CAM_ASM_000754 /LENGTH=40 /DNA_ID= /DNA_START= /DNA_END= /DNA_ORIENTATION=
MAALPPPEAEQQKAGVLLRDLLKPAWYDRSALAAPKEIAG